MNELLRPPGRNLYRRFLGLMRRLRGSVTRRDTVRPSSTFVGNLAKVANVPRPVTNSDPHIAYSLHLTTPTTQHRTPLKKEEWQGCGRKKESHRGVLLRVLVANLSSFLSCQSPPQHPTYPYSASPVDPDLLHTSAPDIFSEWFRARPLAPS